MGQPSRKCLAGISATRPPQPYPSSGCCAIAELFVQLEVVEQSMLDPVADLGRIQRPGAQFLLRVHRFHHRLDDLLGQVGRRVELLLRVARRLLLQSLRFERLLAQRVDERQRVAAGGFAGGWPCVRCSGYFPWAKGFAGVRPCVRCSGGASPRFRWPSFAIWRTSWTAAGHGGQG